MDTDVNEKFVRPEDGGLGKVLSQMCYTPVVRNWLFSVKGGWWVGAILKTVARARYHYYKSFQIKLVH